MALRRAFGHNIAALVTSTPDKPARFEPRWPAVLAILAIIGLFAALPGYLTVGPRWVQVTVAIALLIPTMIAHYHGNKRLNIVLGHILGCVLTASLLWSLVFLIASLPSHKESPTALLRSAACLWLSNVLVFAQWYWRLDAGGPHHRSRREDHTDGAFLFPQMTLQDSEPWSPEFMDYLFLAFNTSTAFSPTDAPVLSRWAKGMMMTQSLISLTVVVILAGRVVNIF